MTMESYEALLKARDGISDTENVMACLQEFERKAQANQLSDDEFTACIGVIQEISAVSRAAQEGISAARNLLFEVLKVKQSLEVYDPEGKKSVNPSYGPLRSKF